MNLIQTSVVIGILCFAVEILANVKSDNKLIKWLPITILLAFSVYNFIYWITGIGTYNYNDILSGREADALCQAVIIGSGIVGCVTAGLICWMFKKKKGRREDEEV